MIWGLKPGSAKQGAAHAAFISSPDTVVKVDEYVIDRQQHVSCEMAAWREYVLCYFPS